MYVAIALGFTYDTDVDKFMPGVVIDLYRTYNFCRHSGSMCFILTDMVEHPDEIRSFILETRYDGDIERFTPTLQPGETPLPGLEFRCVRSLQDIVDALDEIELNEEPHIMFYYSGHGTADKGMMLPSKETMDYFQIRDALLERCSDDAEIILLVDCCNAGGWELPYRLDPARKRFRLTNLQRPVIPFVIMISSSGLEEKAVVCRRGSFFTQYFFERMSSRFSADISSLVRNIQHDVKKTVFGVAEVDEANALASSTVSAYSSYPVVPTLWSWLTCHGVIITPSPANACVLIEMMGEVEPAVGETEV